MVANRTFRTLSAFNRSTRLWSPVPLPPVSLRSARRYPQTLSIVSWNIDSVSARPLTRSQLILGHILDGQKSPDIIFLQEVTTEVRASILDDARIRAAFLVTDAEDQRSFEGVPFATMTLLSRASSLPGDGIAGGSEKFMFRDISRIALPSVYKRDALCLDIIPSSGPDRVLRLINVHLDSFEANKLSFRARQIAMLADVLQNSECSGGMIAGTFNAITLEDDWLVGKMGLKDAWVALHGEDPSKGATGKTWGGRGAQRLDKVVLKGLLASEIEVLHPGSIEVPRSGEEIVEIPWSDHCGLRCTFTI